METFPTERGMSAVSLPLTFESSTSNSTALHGIGSVTGGAIMSVGKFALRGMEVIAIKRRMSSIHSAIVSSGGQAPLSDDMCEDLLELSRHGVHSERVWRKAWGCILLLISARNTETLIECLLKWRDADIKLFFLDLFKVVPRGWLFVSAGDPFPVCKGARHLQDKDSSPLPMQLVYFLHSLLDASEKRKRRTDGVDDDQRSTLSFASFVNISGKLALGPAVFLQNLNTYAGHAVVECLVRFYICARLNRISVMLRTRNHERHSTSARASFGLLSEVLEIFRLFSTHRGVQKQTKELLFIAISNFHTKSLVKTLTIWPPSLLRLFVILVMRWTQAFVKPSLSMDETALPKAYRVHLMMHSKGCHPVLPFLYFLTKLALSNEVAAGIIFDLQIISVLKTMCVHNYPNPASFIAPSPGNKGGIAVSDVCAMSIMLIGALSTHPNACRQMLRLRDFPRWFLSFYYNSEFLGIPDSPFLQTLWVKLEAKVMKFVLVCVEHVLKDGRLRATPQEADYLPLELIYQDIIGILRNPSAESEVLQSAADSLFRCIVLRGVFTNTLDAALANGSSSEAIKILQTAAKCLGLYTEDIPSFPPTLGHVKQHVTRLARVYVNESDLKVYTPLVADMVGSYACNAHNLFMGRYIPPQQPLLTENASVPN